MSIKIGDKVRVTGRPENEVYQVSGVPYNGALELNYNFVVPESWLTVVDREPETLIADWEPGDCGVDIDGDNWGRVVGGAVCFSEADGELVTFRTTSLKEQNLTARKDPTLKFTFAWEKQ